jgi:hypothetical protein
MEIVWPELLSNLVYEVGASRRWQNRTAKLLAFPVTNPWLLNPDRTNPGYQFPLWKVTVTHDRSLACLGPLLPILFQIFVDRVPPIA